jgi:hypothetical protein
MQDKGQNEPWSKSGAFAIFKLRPPIGYADPQKPLQESRGMMSKPQMGRCATVKSHRSANCWLIQVIASHFCSRIIRQSTVTSSSVAGIEAKAELVHPCSDIIVSLDLVHKRAERSAACHEREHGSKCWECKTSVVLSIPNMLTSERAF